jgi:predicted transcriptional regulator of viral defense system
VASLGQAPVFTLEAARAAGLSKDQVYRMVEAGEVDRMGRGVYVRPDMLDPAVAALAAATVVKPSATMCLTSALVHHDLSDAIPFTTDVALPRGIRHPAGFTHVTWHSFDVATFEVGRTAMAGESGVELWVYSAERTIVDCFRLMHREGSDVAYTALRRWIARQGNSPSSLLQVARAFPKALPRLRNALEALQ